jgi:hypothetical protein
MIAKLSLVAALAGTCLSAESQIEGPKLGFAYDRQAAAVRPILGIPGSALFGEPIALDLKNAIVSPSQNFAIGASGDDSAVQILVFADAKLRPLQGAHAAPDRIVLSPNGTAAALVSGSHLQIFSGLPSDSPVTGEFDLTAAPTALAISDDGAIVLAATAESETSALYSYALDGSSKRLLTAGQITSIAFLNLSHDAVFADAAQRNVILLRDATDASIVSNVDQPTAIAASLDNRTILVTSAASHSITTVSLADGASVSTPCGCTPVTLARLQGGAVFRVTDVGDGPAWLFDSSGPEPRVFFIPQAGVSNE